MWSWVRAPRWVFAARGPPPHSPARHGHANQHLGAPQPFVYQSVPCPSVVGAFTRGAREEQCKSGGGVIAQWASGVWGGSGWWVGGCMDGWVGWGVCSSPMRKLGGNSTSRVHSSVVRAADCRSAGPWFKSGCALLRAAKAQWRALPRPAVTKQDVAARIPCVDPPMPRTWRGLWDALGGGSSNGDAKQARKECEAEKEK